MAPPGAEPKNATKLEDRMTPQQLLWSQARNSPRNRGRSSIGRTTGANPWWGSQVARSVLVPRARSTSQWRTRRGTRRQRQGGTGL